MKCSSESEDRHCFTASARSKLLFQRENHNSFPGYSADIVMAIQIVAEIISLTAWYRSGIMLIGMC